MPEDQSLKPEGFSEAKWQRIKGAVERNCRRKARAQNWGEERTDRCIYGTMRVVADHVKASQERRRNVKTHTGAAT